MKKRLSTILLIVALLAGLSLLLYPTVSDYWNSMHQSYSISEYLEGVADLDEKDYSEMMEVARKYNEDLAAKPIQYTMTELDTARYNQTLRLPSTDVMAYVDIPSIDCSLPIYHGTDEAVLNVAVGHIEWSSLPVGGESTHAVLSGHRGLPSAKLFTNLDKLREGDTFLVQVLGDTLTYEVDQILIVEPQDTEALKIVEGEDYCTLVTCTPYSINTHRLLVRGHRVANAEVAKEIRVTADASQLDPMMVAPIVAIPMLMVFILSVFLQGRRKRNKTISKRRQVQ